ncbi:hypothetical protein [Pseudomonas aeruginosa]
MQIRTDHAPLDFTK